MNIRLPQGLVDQHTQFTFRRKNLTAQDIIFGKTCHKNFPLRNSFPVIGDVDITIISFFSIRVRNFVALIKQQSIRPGFAIILAEHAENAEVADFGSKEMSAIHCKDFAMHDDARPWWVEQEAISRAVLFARETGARLYICHMTIAQGAAFLKQAKFEGVNVSVETCPHYLLFDKTILRERGAYAKCNPPFRSRENVEKLWSYILDGTIDTLGSDHGPYRDDEKVQAGDFWKEYSGFGGFDAMLAAMLTEGYHRRGLSLSRLSCLTATNAANIMQLAPRKGSLLPGRDADILVVDLDREWVFDGTKSLSKTKTVHNLYHGMKMKGKVEQTYVRGQLVYNDGEITAQNGFGQYIPRQA